MPRHVYLFVIISAFIAAIVSVPAQVRANETTVVVYPRLYNFPGQQLCQVDRADRRYREFCSPQSYHPYGAFGYRPLGTYRPYRSARRHWVAPDARIVHVDP